MASSRERQSRGSGIYRQAGVAVMTVPPHRAAEDDVDLALLADRVEQQDETIGMLCKALDQAAFWFDEMEAACTSLNTAASHMVATQWRVRGQSLRTAIVRACSPEDPNL
jgi:hypothetical protein